MRLPDFEYQEPGSIGEAMAFLKDHAPEARISAGGTDIFPSMKQRLFTPKYLLHLGNLQGLDHMAYDERSGLTMGAFIRLHTLETDPVIRERYPIIAEAAQSIAAGQLRRMGTLGGNLCLDTRCYYYNQSRVWRTCRPTCIKMLGDTCNAVGGRKKCFAIFSGDLAPALMALDVKVRVLSPRGERTLTLEELYTGKGDKPLSLGSDEVLVSVEVPALREGTFSTYLKYRIRRSVDFPLAGVAMRLDMDREKGLCREVKVVISAVGPRPQVVEGISELLEGRGMEDARIEEASELAFKAAKPVANAASSPSYRRLMIKILVKKAFSLALKDEV